MCQKNWSQIQKLALLHSQHAYEIFAFYTVTYLISIVAKCTTYALIQRVSVFGYYLVYLHSHFHDVSYQITPRFNSTYNTIFRVK